MDSSSSDDRIIGKYKTEEEVEEKESFKKSKNEEEQSSADELSSSESESNSEHNKVSKSESNIRDLLDDALDIILMKIKVGDKQVRNSYCNIKESFRHHAFMFTNFDEAENFIAYTYGYALYNSAISLNRFRDAFQNCRELKEAIRRTNLNVISLGGGPGTDMVAFCTALEEKLESIKSTKSLASKKSTELTNSFESLNISVVDIFKRYESLFNIIQFLIREGDYGYVSKLYKRQDIFSSFMRVDLFEHEKNQPLKYKTDLASADIVILARVIDALYFEKQQPEKLFEKIFLGMKEGALLLCIDTTEKCWKPYRFTEVYKSNLNVFDFPVQLKKRFLFKTNVSPSKAEIYIYEKI